MSQNVAASKIGLNSPLFQDVMTPGDRQVSEKKSIGMACPQAARGLVIQGNRDNAQWETTPRHRVKTKMKESSEETNQPEP